MLTWTDGGPAPGGLRTIGGYMAVYRQAKGRCPACGAWARKTVPEGRHRARKQGLECKCGERFTVAIEGAWWAAWREPSGRYHRERFIGPSARARAVEAEGKARQAIKAGDYRGVAPDAPSTLGELFELYLQSIAHKRRPANLANERHVARYLTDAIGAGLAPGKITTATAETYRTRETERGLAPATINRRLALLRVALGWARSRGWVSSVPEIKNVNPHNERVDFYTREEAAAIIMAAEPPWRNAIRAAFATGLRRRELLSMRWEWINDAAGVVNVPAEATKNHRARFIPINADLRAVLDEQRRLAVPGAPVFHYGDGRPLPASSTCYFAWCRAAAKAGVRRLPFHSARHSFASWMAQAGVDLNRIRELLGHQSFRMVQRYSHLRPDHLRDAVDAACLSTSGPNEAEAAEPAHVVALADRRK